MAQHAKTATPGVASNSPTVARGIQELMEAMTRFGQLVGNSVTQSTVPNLGGRILSPEEATHIRTASFVFALSLAVLVLSVIESIPRRTLIWG